MSGRSVAVLWVAGSSALLCGVIGSAALPKLNKARMYAQEAAALKALQALNTAQVEYNSQFGRFAQSLSELGPRVSNLISTDLAGGEKQGYKFTLAATPQGYSIQAVPVAFGSTGSRTFYTDQSLLLRENYGPEPATVNNEEVRSAAKSSQGAP